MLVKSFTFRKVASYNFKFIAICFYFLFWKAVFWLFSENSPKKFKEKKLLWGRGWKKKMKLSDFFLRIFLKSRIFLPRYSPKESCKKWFNWALWAKSMKLGKKCISVYVITKMNGNHFLPSSMKQVIRKQKMKNHFHEKFFVVWFDTHSYRELTIFAKAYLSNLKLIKQGEIQKLLPKNR